MIRQVVAATGMTALVISLIVPCYCLFMTPGPAARTYAAVFAAIGTELPPITQACIVFPKFVMIATCLLSSGLQAWLCVYVRPRWWAIVIVASQLGMAMVLSVLFMYWHIGIVHLPTLKVLFDLF